MARVATTWLALLVTALCILAGPVPSVRAQEEEDVGDEKQSAQTPADVAYQPTGPLIADSGFRPEKDGYSFENYTAEANPTDLTPVEVKRLFGPGVCEDPEAESCTLTPPAEQYLEKTNEQMGGGHCEGFSVTSELFYNKLGEELGTAAKFGADQTFGVKFPDNTPLQSFIAYGWAWQTLDAVTGATLKLRPSQTVDKLAEAFANKNEVYTLGIYKRDRKGGHAITPYAIEDKGEGKVNILVYDNNYPGQTRAVEVNRQAETWTYQASANPQEAADTYDGDHTTNPLELEPVKPGLGVQPCPFCRTAQAKDIFPRQASARKYNQISLLGDEDENGSLRITDDKGRRMGFVGEEFVNEIPGAVRQDLRLNKVWVEEVDPVYKVPLGVRFTISLTGKSLKEDDSEEVVMIGPGYSVSVDDIDLDPGQVDRIEVAPDGRMVSYRSSDGGGESPRITLGTETRGADYEMDFKEVDRVKRGSRVKFVNDEVDRRLTIDNRGAKEPSKFKFSLARLDSRGELEFTRPRLRLAPGEQLTLSYGSFTRNGKEIPVVSTRKGKSTRSVLKDAK